MSDQSEKGIDSLLLWKKSIDYALQINERVLPLLPSAEKFAMAAQLRRSTQSIPANIAEGFGRFYYQEGIRFCYIARGSLEETYSHLVFAQKMGYLSTELFGECAVRTQEIRKLINGYIAYLKRSKRGVNEPGNNSIREEFETYLIDNEDNQND